MTPSPRHQGSGASPTCRRGPLPARGLRRWRPGTEGGSDQWTLTNKNEQLGYKGITNIYKSITSNIIQTFIKVAHYNLTTSGHPLGRCLRRLSLRTTWKDSKGWRSGIHLGCAWGRTLHNSEDGRPWRCCPSSTTRSGWGVAYRDPC